MQRNIILKKNKILIKFSQKEITRLLGRSFYSDLRLNLLTRFYFYFGFLLKDYYLTKLNLYCFYTYKTKSIVKPFKMHRMVFRTQCSFGMLSGIRKGVQ